MNSLVSIMKQNGSYRDAINDNFCSEIANGVASSEATSDAMKKTYNVAIKLVKKYEKEIRAKQYKVCNINKYGLLGGGSIVEKVGNVIVFGSVQYFE